MALETTYEGPPSLKIYQEFVRVSTSTAVEQDVVVLAPHYDVVTVDDQSSSSENEYTAGTAWTKTWDKSDVDYTNARLYAKNAYCQQAEFSSEDSSSADQVKFQGVYGIKFGQSLSGSGFEEPVAVGDLVQVEYTLDDSSSSEDVVSEDVVKVCKVIDIGNVVTRHAITASDIKKVTSTGEVTATGFQVNTGTYLGSSACTYYLTVLSVDTTNSKVTFSYDTSDGHDSGDALEIGTSATLIGNSGIELSITDASVFVVGTVYKYDVTGAEEVENRIIYVDTNLYDGTAPSAFTVKLAKAKEFYVANTQFTATSTGITTLATIKHNVWGTGLVNILKADLYTEYRALNKTYVNKLGSISADNTVTALLGDTSVNNPLGCMVAAARKGGETVYFVAVNADTVAAYEKAFSLISKSTNAYALVIHSLKQEVIAAATTFIEQQSAPEVANYKILYYGLDSDNNANIMKNNASGAPLMASINASGECTLNTTRAGAITFLTAKVKEGDILYTNPGIASDGSTEFKATYTVVDVVNATTLNLKWESGTQALNVDKNFEIWRTLEGSELIDELKTRVYTTNRRCYCVFGDGINVDGIEDAPAWLIAALPAGMRSGEYCQRPISNIAYDGVTAEPKLVFSAAERLELAGRGVWILASNDDGSQVYNYHQLSTDMTDKKTQEQSYTTNFDNISFGARSLLAPYYGNSNISDEFIQQVLTNVDAFLVGKTKNAPSAPIGPQLLSYENLTIEQDSVNKDHVYMYVDYDMPAPFNHIEFHQRLL